MIDGRVKQAGKLLVVACGAKSPHGLCNQGLGGHVATFEDTGVLGVCAPNFVNTQVEPLFGDLCGHNDGFPQADPIKDSLLIGSLIRVVFGHASHAKGFQNHAVIIRLEQAEDIGCEAGRELERAYAAVEFGGEDGAALFVFMRKAAGNTIAPDDPILTDIRKDGIIDAGKRIEAHGALLAGARAGNGVPAKYDADVARAVIEYDGLGAVLHKVGQGRGGVCHGVGSMQDNEAVVRIVIVVDHTGDFQPIYRAHVSAVDVHGLYDVKLA